MCCKCAAVNCGVIKPSDLMPIVASVLPCVAVSCSVLQFVVVCSGWVKPIDLMPIVASVLQRVAVCCCVLQVRCSELRWNTAD